MKKTVLLLLLAACLFAGCSKKKTAQEAELNLNEIITPAETVVVKETIYEVTKRFYNDEEVRKVEIYLPYDKISDPRSMGKEILSFPKLADDEKLLITLSGVVSDKNGKELYNPGKFVLEEESFLTEDGKSAVLVIRRNMDGREVIYIDGKKGTVKSILSNISYRLLGSKTLKAVVYGEYKKINVLSGIGEPKIYTYSFPDVNRFFEGGSLSELSYVSLIENKEKKELVYNDDSECVVGSWIITNNDKPEVKAIYYPECGLTWFETVEENDLFWDKGIISPKPEKPSKSKILIERNNLSEGEYLLFPDNDDEIVFIGFQDEETFLGWHDFNSVVIVSFGVALSEKDVLKKEVYEENGKVTGKITMKDGTVYTAQFK